MRELHRALDDAREDRASALRGEALAHDTLHRVDRCARCGRVSRRVALLADAPGGDSAASIAAWTASQPERLPLVEVGCECPEAAAGRLAALAYVRACAGRGEECVYEGVDEGEGWSWRWRRRALDGASEPCEVDALPPLSAREVWRGALDEAAGGAPVLARVEAGLWVFAGPREASLEARVKARVGECARGLLLPLKLLAWRPVVPTSEAWTTWAPAHAEAIRAGELRAGAVIDAEVLRELVRVAACRAGVALDDDDGASVTLRRGEFARAVDLDRLALSLALRGEGLALGAARAVAATLDMLADAAAIAAEVRGMRPEVRFTAAGWSLVPERPDGSQGPAIALPERRERSPRADEDLERAVRFGCDVLPPWSDPSRVCPCGAPACFVARVLPPGAMTAVEGTPSAPVVLARWPEDAPRAALVAGVGCELHTWFPSAEALAAQGMSSQDVAARVRAEAPLATFAVTSRVVEEGGARALIARGHHVASAMVDDHLLTALHRACGAPLRGPEVGALAVATDALILHERGWRDEDLDRLCTSLALEAGAPSQGPDALLVSRDARVDALPRGRVLPRDVAEGA
ncbi:MAG: hypothetical protein R3A48_26010 [Polyangiales bacterium]